MAKRVNKKLVAGLTFVGMAVMTAGVVFLLVKVLPKKDPGQMAGEAEKYVARGEYFEAAKAYVKAAQRAEDRGDPVEDTADRICEYLLKAGDMFLESGQIEPALKTLLNAKLALTSSAAPRERLIERYVEFGKHQDLVRESNDLLSLEGQNENPIGHYGRGLAHLNTFGTDMSLLHSAIADLERAVELAPGNADYVNALTIAYLTRLEREGLYTDFRQLAQSARLGSDEGRQIAERIKTEQNQLIGLHNKLVAEAVKAHNADSSEDNWRVLAEAYRARGNFYASDYMRRFVAIRIQLEQSTDKARQDAFSEEHAAYHAKAQDDLAAALREIPEKEAQERAEYLVTFGQFLEQRHEDVKPTPQAGIPATAEEAYGLAADTYPDGVIAHVALVELLRDQDQPEEALDQAKMRIERGLSKEQHAHYNAGSYRFAMCMLYEKAFMLNKQLWETAEMRFLDPAEVKKERGARLADMEALRDRMAAATTLLENHPLVHCMDGRLALLKGDFLEAARRLEDADKRRQAGENPLERLDLATWLDLRVLMAGLQLREDQLGGAAALLATADMEEYLKQTQHGEGLSLLAEIHRQQGNYLKSTELAELAFSATDLELRQKLMAAQIAMTAYQQLGNAKQQAVWSTRIRLLQIASTRELLTKLDELAEPLRASDSPNRAATDQLALRLGGTANLIATGSMSFDTAALTDCGSVVSALIAAYGKLKDGEKQNDWTAIRDQLDARKPEAELVDTLRLVISEQLDDVQTREENLAKAEATFAEARGSVELLKLDEDKVNQCIRMADLIVEVCGIINDSGRLQKWQQTRKELLDGSTTGRMREAQTLLQEAVQQDLPDREKLRKADQLLAEVVKLDPLNEAAIRYRVGIKLQLQEFREISQLLNEAQYTTGQARARATDEGNQETADEADRLLELIKQMRIQADPNLPFWQRAELEVATAQDIENEYARSIRLSRIYLKYGKLDKAIENLKLAWSGWTDPVTNAAIVQELTTAQKAARLTEVFELALNLKAWSIAEECQTEAIEQNLLDTQGHWFSGRLAFARGHDYRNANKPDEAVTAFREARTQYEETLKLRQNFADAHFALGRTLLMLEEFEGAIGAFGQARRLSHESGGPAIWLARAHQAKGKSLHQQGKLAEARTSFAAAEDLLRPISMDKGNPNWLDATDALYLVYMDQEPPKLTEARQVAEKANTRGQAQEVARPVWIARLALVEFKLGHDSEAINLARQAWGEVTRRPGYIVTYRDQTRIVLDVLRQVNAPELFIQALADVGAYADLITYVNEERFPEAQRSWNLHGITAVAYAATSETEKAMSEAEKAFEKMEPKTPATFVNSVTLEMVKRLDRAELEQIVDARLEENSLNYPALLTKLVILEVAHRYGEVDQLMSRVMPSVPDEQNVMRLYLLRTQAQNQQMSGQYDQALASYKAALEIAPNDLKTLNNMAMLLIDAMNKPEEALQYSRKAYESAPESIPVIDTYAWNLILDGQLDDGIKLLEDIRQFSEQAENAEIIYHLSYAYHQKKDRDQAVKLLRMADGFAVDKPVATPQIVKEKIHELGQELGVEINVSLKETEPESGS